MRVEIIAYVTLSILLATVALMTFGGTKFLLKTIPFRNGSIWKAKRNLYLISLALLCMGLTGIMTGNDKTKVSIAKKSDVLFLIDFSSSMLVKDVNGESRVDVVLDNLYESIDQLDAGRIGISIFSELEYRLIPFTYDKNFIKQSIVSLQQNVIPSGGGDIGVAFDELMLREKNNKEMNIFIFSDFENVGVQNEKIKSIQEYFRIFAVGVGSSSGGKIPIPKKQKFERQKYLTKNGKTIYSYFSNKDFQKFDNRAMISTVNNSLINNYILSNSTNHEKESEWQTVGNEPFGVYFIFVGVLLLTVSRGLIFFSKNYFSLLVFYLVFSSGYSYALDSNNPTVLNKIKMGNGNHADFLLFANSLAQEENYQGALRIYQERIKFLNKLEKINLGTLQFLNGFHSKGLSEYVKYLENGNSSSEEYKIVKNNLILLFKNGSGGNAKGPGEDSAEKGDESSSGKGGDSEATNDGKGKSSNLSNGEILEKVESDDMVNQGEYIKKKTQLDKKRREVKW